MSETMPQELSLAALHMAVTNRRRGAGLLHHSDRGGRRAAHVHRRALDQHGMRCPVSRTGNGWNNAPTESFLRSLKTELDGERPFGTRQAARTALFRATELRTIEFRAIEGWHNRERLHSSLGCMTPANKDQLAAAA